MKGISEISGMLHALVKRVAAIEKQVALVMDSGVENNTEEVKAVEETSVKESSRKYNSDLVK